MSLFNRRTLLKTALSGAVLTLGACGFTPVYGPKGAGMSLRGKVDVQAPDDAQSYALFERLQKRLGPVQSPAFSLSYEITTASHTVGVSAQEAITRYHLTGQAKYSLRDSAGGDLKTGTVSNFTAYSAVGSDVALITARRDAYDRLMVLLADQIVIGLLGAVSRP